MPAKKRAFTLDDVKQETGTGYPPPYNEIANGRYKARVGDHAGLSQYGVNIVTLPPGAGSAQRHWHKREEEFTCMISGEVVLITDDGEETITPGMMMGWPANVPNAHHLVNRSDEPAVYMEIGTRFQNDTCHYPDVDLHLEIRDGVDTFTHKDGTPYD